MTNTLADAVARLRYRQIKALLDKGVSINGRLDDGRTPLMVTLELENPDKRRRMFKFLVHHGADALESDLDDVTIFQHCCRLGYLDLMELILKKAGVSAVNILGRDKFGRTSIYHAVVSERVDVVNTVLNHINLRQQSVDVPDNVGLTPLLYARRRGLVEIADILIERGKANPRICDGQMHMNADEWAEEARRREREEQAAARKQARERYMIFPPIDHATKRKEKMAKMKSKTASLPNLSMAIAETPPPSTPPPNVNHLPTDASRTQLPLISPVSSRSPYALPDDFRTKSIDSAITLLGLASNNADNKEYAVSFVSSKQHQPSQQSLQKGHGDRHMRRTWDNMMDAYSIQNTGNFRKPAKAPVLPEIHPELNESGSKSKMSTLAFIFKSTRGGKADGKGPRGRHSKLRSISESAADRSNQGLAPGKLARRRTTSLSGASTDGGDKRSKKTPLPEVKETDDPDEKTTHKESALPNIKIHVT